MALSSNSWHSCLQKQPFSSFPSCCDVLSSVSLCVFTWPDYKSTPFLQYNLLLTQSSFPINPHLSFPGSTFCVQQCYELSSCFSTHGKQIFLGPTGNCVTSVFLWYILGELRLLQNASVHHYLSSRGAWQSVSKGNTVGWRVGQQCRILLIWRIWVWFSTSNNWQGKTVSNPSSERPIALFWILLVLHSVNTYIQT